MKFFAINGSPRKNGNTATVLRSALEGAASAAGPGAETTLLHLYDIPFMSCVSCFECKRLEGRSYGRCALTDPLAPVLENLARADGLIFGSPVYFGGITGKMKSFLERLLFPYFVYDANYSSLAPKKMPTACIYTMNVTEEVMGEHGYPAHLGVMEGFVERVFAKPAIVYVNDTYQFHDYSKYKVECFSETEKARRREEHFPLDCRAAFEIGAGLAAASFA